MWYVLFILLFALAVLLWLIAIIFEDNAYWNMISMTLASVIWLVLALSNMEIEIPYTAITSADAIVTGVHTYSSPISPYITYLFGGFFFVSQIYLWAMVWDTWFNYNNWHGGN